ncbi:MAG TPA: GTPase, partial [candidate division Zixibacteria bacterium]|nr:GTPase [candidate division Zixibacteria bacterium]
PHIDHGAVVFAGNDYHAIIKEAEREADVILWDGGNNDMPFYRPDLMITVADPHRPGNEERYYPGLANLLLAEVVVINKIETATPEGIERVRRSIEKHNASALVIDAASPVSVERPELVHGKRVLVIEDGPTLTHGEMAYGAGYVAARKFGAAELVSPIPFLKGSLVTTMEHYSHQQNVLPAMGYGDAQIADLQATIDSAAKSGAVDSILIATPIDLSRVLKLPANVNAVRVRYDLQEIGAPDLTSVLRKFHVEKFGEPALTQAAGA